MDLSRANAMIEPQQYHIPDVQEMYNKLQGSKYISLIDLKSGYWLCPLEKESQDITSFTTPFGTYKYTVCPMGLLTSAAHFQRFVERKLRNHGLLYEPTVKGGPKSDVNQAEESRSELDTDVDDSVACEESNPSSDSAGKNPERARLRTRPQ